MASPPTTPTTPITSGTKSGQVGPNEWKLDEKNQLCIDVSTGNFAKIPTYLISLGALGATSGDADHIGHTGHWKVIGSSSVYSRKKKEPDDLKKGFRVYLRPADGTDKIDKEVFDVKYVKDHRFYINWVAIPAP
jgi:hypothetical protein